MILRNDDVGAMNARHNNTGGFRDSRPNAPESGNGGIGFMGYGQAPGGLKVMRRKNFGVGYIQAHRRRIAESHV